MALYYVVLSCVLSSFIEIAGPKRLVPVVIKHNGYKHSRIKQSYQTGPSRIYDSVAADSFPVVTLIGIMKKLCFIIKWYKNMLQITGKHCKWYVRLVLIFTPNTIAI